jgi:hypothetical protein
MKKKKIEQKLRLETFSFYLPHGTLNQFLYHKQPIIIMDNHRNWFYLSHNIIIIIIILCFYESLIKILLRGNCMGL